MNVSLPAKTRPRDFWQTLDTVLLCALIVAMCSQINLRAIGRDTLASEGFVTKQLFLALSDVMFLGVFLWFCARTTMLRAWRKVWIPPLPCWILIFAMLLSALHSARIIDATAETLSQSHGALGALKSLAKTKEFKEAAAEIIQFAATFLLAPLLFVNLLRDRRMQNASTREYSQGNVIDRTQVAIWAFGAVYILNFFAAIFLKSDGLSQSLWSSPNIYSTFLSLVIAFFITLALSTEELYVSSKTKRRVPFIFSALGLTIYLFVQVLASNHFSSVWPLFAVLIGLILGVIAMRLRKFSTLASTLFFVLALIVATQTWRDGGNRKQQALAASWHISTPTQRVKKQYVEWYAAMGWSRPSRNRFATGVGAGNYQFNVGSYYGGLPNEEKMPPDSNNLYLVQMVSLGALGLGALLWVLAHFMKIAWRAARNSRAASTRNSGAALGAATFAALFAFAFVNVFHAGLVRGMSLVLAFLFSLAIVAWQQSESAAKNETIEEIINEE